MSAGKIIQRGDAEARSKEVNRCEEMNVFGVLLSYEDTFFLAHSACAAPQIFYSRKAAVAFKKDLLKNGFKSAKVVPVFASFYFPAPRLRVSALKKSGGNA